MSPRPRLLAVLVLSAVTLSLLDGDRALSGPLRTAVDTALAPVDRLAASATAAFDGSADLQRLREENARLRRELAAGEGDARTAAEWRALLGLTAERDWAVVPARVVGAGGALGFERTVVLDAGSRDGVDVGQTVLAGGGLVGRTVRVGPWTSTVLLLDDPRSGVGARLAATGALGLVNGEGAGRVRWVQVDAGEVADGAVLVTTGSDTFVPDLPVGRVRDAETAAGGLTTTALVEPLVDLDRLDLVGVVVDGARSAPRAPLAPPS